MSGHMIGFAAVVLIFGVMPIGFMIYLHKSKTKKLDTLVKIVELGGNVDPEMMQILGERGGSYKTDYKYGLIWLSIGLPVTLGIWMLSGFGQAVFGAIPVFIGLAFLISGKYRLRESS